MDKQQQLEQQQKEQHSNMINRMANNFAAELAVKTVRLSTLEEVVEVQKQQIAELTQKLEEQTNDTQSK